MRVKLFKGNAIVNGRQSPYTLYDEKLATYTKEDAFNQEAVLALSTSMDYQHRSMRCYMEVIVMSNKAWGGRFEAQPEDWVDDFIASIDFDKNLINQDVQGSIAHATMLANQSIISQDEAEAIIKGLKEIQKDFNEGHIEFKAFRRYTSEY